MLRTLLLIVLCVVSCWNAACALGCKSCPQTHSQEDFCNSDYVVEAKILSMLGRMSFTPYQPYNVKILHIYKGKKLFENGLRRDVLFVPGRMHFCGEVKVNVDDIYLIQGYTRQNSMYANVCGSVIHIDHITSTRALIMEKFDCLCGLYTDFTWDITKPMPKSAFPDKCVSPIPGSCAFTNGACVKTPQMNNTCQWNIVQPCS